MRLGFVAGSLVEAAERLARWRSGEAAALHVHVPADEDAPGHAFDSGAGFDVGAGLEALVVAWTRGAQVPWATLDLPGRRTVVPALPFMRRRYWPKTVDAVEPRPFATDVPLERTAGVPQARAADVPHLPAPEMPAPDLLLPVWREVAAGTAPEPPRHLMIVHGAGTRALAQALGDAVDHATRLDLLDRDEAGLRQALQAGPIPVDAVVVLGDPVGMQDDGVAAPGDPVVAAAQAELLALGFLAVARALSRCPAALRPATLIVVTSGLHDVTGGDGIDPIGAALPGMARSVGRRAAGTRGGVGRYRSRPARRPAWRPD